MPGGSPCFLRSGDFCRVEVLARHRRPEASSSVTTLLHRPSVPVSVTLPEQGALTALPSAQA